MQKFKQKTAKILTKLRSFSPLQYALATVLTVYILLIISLVSFLWPKNIDYNFASDKTCFSNPIILPNTFRINSEQNYQITHTNSVKIKNYPLFSKKSCVTIKKLDQTGTNIKLLPLGNSVFAQKINIKLPETPKITYSQKTDGPISTIGKLELSLSQADKTFSYHVQSKQKISNCQKNEKILICDLTPLALAQSQKYELEFVSKLNEQIIGTVYKTSVQTVDPIVVTSQSISNGALVYDAPTQVIITTNKDLASFSGVKLTNLTTSTELKNTSKIDGKNLLVNFDQPLPREVTIGLTIEQLTATDQAFLTTAFTTNFVTSGGPKVINKNFGTYGESTNKNFVLNLDSGLLAGQNLSALVSIIGPSGAIPANISATGNSITISPVPALPRCTTFTIKLLPGLKNSYAIENSAGFSATTRTICQEVFSIGYSVQGRSITAYKFGNGPTKTIFVGTTHGDEASSKYTLDSWVNELEVNFHKVPSGRTIYVIPNLNPDAFAARSRVNANNVDLNRNFPADNWKADVTIPGGTLVVNGGGTTALSEPESLAIANFISAQAPELVLTYHSKGSMVIANESGDSVSRANTYGSYSGYWARKETDLGTTFAYDTTGAMENWLHDKKDIATLLIELSAHTSNEFSRNKNAMWAMIN